MKISKRDQKLLLCAGGILLAVAAYFFVFRNMSEKNSKIESENQTLEAQVQQLELLDAKKEQYIEDAESLNQKAQEIISQFPAEIREETAIMYAYDMENKADIHINSMSITPKNLLYTLGIGLAGANTADGTAANGTTADGTAANGTPTDGTAANGTTTDGTAADGTTADGTASSEVQSSVKYLYVMTVNLDYSVTYDGFKSIIDFIQTNADKRNVENISLSYDSESGNLLGTMVVNLFELSGTDKQYQAPYIPSMPQGNTNPFGTAGAAGTAGTETGTEATQENQGEASQNGTEQNQQ